MSDEKPCILFVEDEVFIGLETKLLLEEAGYRVVGPLCSVAEALATLETVRPDLGLLDVNLNGTRVTPVAERLCACAIPFALLTGYSPETLDEPVLRDAALLRKPFDEHQAFGLLRRLLEDSAGSAEGRGP